MWGDGVPVGPGTAVAISPAMTLDHDYYEAMTVEIGPRGGRPRAPSSDPAGAAWDDISLTTRFELSDVAGSIRRMDRRRGRTPPPPPRPTAR